MTQVTIDAAKRASYAEVEPCLMVDADDWARIRRDVARLGDPIVDWAALWASVAVGAAIAMLAVAVSIHTTAKEPHQELLTALKVAIGACFLFAVAFGAVGLRERRRHAITSQGIGEDMDSVASRLGHSGLGVPTPRRRRGVKGWVLRLWRGDEQPREPPREPPRASPDDEPTAQAA